MDSEVNKTVMVSGANGYVASWLVKKLLEQGYTVHGCVRDPHNSKKVGFLHDLAQNSSGTLKLFKADLLQPESFIEPMQGCTTVFHTASPFSTVVKDPQKDLVDPAVQGTVNVLQAASKTPGVSRVVLTSSCAAMYADCLDVQNAPGGVLTEKIWNTTASLEYQPYSYSKTVAEKKAWELCEKQTQWDLVVINPSLVLGPALNAAATTSESFSLLRQLGDGTMRFGVPDVGIGVVDVRDVAEAHLKAATLPDARGRYITSGHNSSFVEIAQILNAKYGKKYPISPKKLPKWLLLLIGPMVNKSLSRKFIANNVGIAWRADASKSVSELNMDYTDLVTTLVDAFESAISAKLV